jgi:hypothetical protein
MTESAALSGLVQPGRRIVPDAHRARPEPFQPAERRPAAVESRPEPKTGGTLPKPLLSGETRLSAQTTEDGQAGKSGAALAGAETLTDDEQQQVQDLQRRDREVRAHEQAHKAAGGSLAGHPTFETVRGPDGQSYAVSGEVKIDTGTVPNNPEATIRKMEQVKRAALAPSNPSSADRQVAAEADAKIQQARQEKREQEAVEREKAKGGGASPESAGSAKPGAGLNVVV